MGSELTKESPVRPLTSLDATAARRWAVLSRAALATHRRELDALNVFPVPDGDTGTNLYLTFDAAMDTARTDPAGAVATERADRREEATGTLSEAAEALAHATLLAARGNSGVILSQIVRGLAEVVVAEGGSLDGPGLARALQRASELASASVSRPVEGTILSVAQRAAEAASSAAASDGTLYAVSQAALAVAREALAGTTAQLPQLAAAGVVDAGAAGYVLLLRALDAVVSGESPDSGAGVVSEAGLDSAASRSPAGDPTRDAMSDAAQSCEGNGDGDVGRDGGGPAYEVMFLLAESTAEAAGTLQEALCELGDSVVVAGGAAALGGSAVWHVHAHVDDVGAAVEAGIAAGRPYQIKVTSFGATTSRTGSDAGAGTGGSDVRDVRGARSATRAPAVVAWATGDGLGRLFTTAGATLVPNGSGQRPSAADVLAAVEAAGAPSVLILPNDRDVLVAAESVVEIAADRGIDVHVVRSRAAVQGIAAMAVFEPAAGPQANLVAMTSAAAATRHGGVTVATREALTSAGWSYAGDVLGIVDDDIVTIGTDLGAVGGVVVDMLLGSGGEILTIVSGHDAPTGLATAVGKAARKKRRHIELSIVDGGQPVQHLLFGVE